MAIKPKKQGIALLVAVIFMSVMLSFGLVLGSLAFKQQTLASSSISSQYAFYAADAGLECVLHADQQDEAFSPYPTSDPGTAPPVFCDGISNSGTSHWSPTLWTLTYRIPLDVKPSSPPSSPPLNPRCADITVYKYKVSLGGLTTYLFSQGYDVSCAAVTAQEGDSNATRFSSRGMSADY